MNTCLADSANLSQIESELQPYQGIICQVNLKTLTFRLDYSFSDNKEKEPIDFKLSSVSKPKTPMSNWGNSFISINKQGHAVEKKRTKQAPEKLSPDIYGLVLSSKGPVVMSTNDVWSEKLLTSYQYIYPTHVSNEQENVAVDLFVSPSQEYIAVVERYTGRVMVIKPATGELIAERCFEAFSNTKAPSLAIHEQERKVWVCGAASPNLWCWNLDANDILLHTGNWIAPSAVCITHQYLWVLDGGNITQVFCLNPEDLKEIACLSLHGESYARHSDLPIDLFQSNVASQWVFCITRSENKTPYFTLIHAGTKQVIHEQSLNAYPQGIGFTRTNIQLLKRKQQSALNQNQKMLHGLVSALYNTYRLSPEILNTEIISLGFQREIYSPGDLPQAEMTLHLVKHLHHLIQESTKATQIQPLQKQDEKELLIHAAYLSAHLQEYSRIQCVLTHTEGKYRVLVDIKRKEILASIAQQDAASYSLNDTLTFAQLKSHLKPDSFACESELLAKNRTGLADPLNSRLLQLDQELKVCWQLDSTLFGLYHPTHICWLPNQAFAIIDPERRQLNAWNENGTARWSIDLPTGRWTKVVAILNGNQQLKSLLLIEQKAKKIYHVDPNGKKLQALNLGLSSSLEILDIAPVSTDMCWLLCLSGEVILYDIEAQKIRHQVHIPETPSILTYSQTQQMLALYDGSNKKIWLYHSQDNAPRQFQLSQEPRYHIDHPISLQWHNTQELLISDAFRVITVDTQTQRVNRHSLLQLSHLNAPPFNEAPEHLFASKSHQYPGNSLGKQFPLLPLLRNIPFFKDVDVSFLKQLAKQARIYIYNAGDTLIHKGDKGTELFVIRQGRVNVMDALGQKPVAQMGPGHVFGEVALMLDLPRNSTVQADSYCEVFGFSREQVDQLLKEYPTAAKHVFALAKSRQKQEKLRSLTHSASHHRLKKLLEISQHKANNSDPKTKPQKTKSTPNPQVQLNEVLTPFKIWVRHKVQGQLAQIDRQEKVHFLVQPVNELVQPTHFISTSEQDWVLERGGSKLHATHENHSQFSLHKTPHYTLNQPRGMCSDTSENLWIANTLAGEVIQLSNKGEFIQAFSQGKSPASIEYLTDTLLISDNRNHTVSEISLSGELLWQYGTSGVFGRTDNQLFSPEYATGLANGNILIADTGNHRVLEIERSGRIVFSTSASPALRMMRPTFVQRLDNGNTLIEHSGQMFWYEVDKQQNVIWRYQLPAKGFSK